MKSSILLMFMLLVGMNISAQSIFEGEIAYRNFENHSKTVRRFSKGMAYNGARNVKVLLKGNKMHIIDESMHLNTLVLPDENAVIIYNDLLKRGLKCSYSNYTQTYMSAYSSKPSVVGQTKKYAVRKTGLTKVIKGEQCSQYKGNVTAQVSGVSPAVTEIEMWCSDRYKTSPTYTYFLNGIEVANLAVKYTTDQHGKIPIFGSMDSFVAAEVKSITPRNVDDSEMQIPADYELKETDSASKMLGIYGDTSKYLKKNKMYPTDADTNTEVTYTIDEEWDF